MEIKAFIFLFLALLCTANSACRFRTKEGNGNIKHRNVRLEQFDRINIGGNYTIKIIPQEKSSVLVRTDENLMEFINIEVYNRTLYINNVHSLSPSHGIQIIIYQKKLTSIKTLGKVNISQSGILTSDTLSIQQNGTGTLQLCLQTQSIHCILAGAGHLALSGVSNELKANISGIGSLNSFPLKNKRCTIHIFGMAKAEIYVTDTLDASVSGIAKIVYTGNPHHITKQITGFGAFKKAPGLIE